MKVAKQDQIQYLLRQYISNASTPEEQKELLDALRTSDYDEEDLLQFLDGMAIKSEADEKYDPAYWKPVVNKILQHREAIVVPFKQARKWKRIAAAASIVLILGIGSYFFFLNKQQKKIAKVEQKYNNDIAPGKNGAILKLSGGQEIVLDSAANGNLAQQSNIRIVKNGNEVTYVIDPSAGNSEVAYNEMRTPKGRQFQLVLSDGSKVRLNAASSIKFPTSFEGSERKVEVTGEVYFEVTHDAKQPFVVITNGTEIHDLGTEFNVNAYSDEEKIKITLVKGSVKVASPGPGVPRSTRDDKTGVTLKPGQQAQIDGRDPSLRSGLRVVNADIEEAIAWKNGNFIFQGSNIQSVMRQLARWYDVEVKYEGSIPTDEFVGDITRSRYSNISQILEILEKTKTVRFEINGRTVTVKRY